MTDRESNPFDEIEYPGYAYSGTYPDHLASIACLFGLDPIPPDHCRVLELGCGDGANLIPMAYNLPDSEFLGIDLAERPITQGCSRIQELELKNISLLPMDLRDFGEGFGRFDYIIAHGVYSWIPADAQDRLMRICRNNLSPDGVVFISYNTYPGSHIRQIVREILMFHIHQAPDAVTKLQQARALSELLENALTPGNELASLMKVEWHGINQRPPGSLYHDELADFNLPVYFHEFVTQAAGHGLQFLAESELFAMDDHSFSDEVRKAMSELEDQRILREQYLDFIRIRRFRQTLLCHQEVDLQGHLHKERLRFLRIASRASVESPTVDLNTQTEAKFRGPNQGVMTTNYPVVKALMLVLIDQWPCSLPFSELLSAIQSRLEGSPVEELALFLEGALLAALKAGVVELRMCEPRVTRNAGERPHVSKVARLQAAKGELMTNLRHVSVRLPNAADRQVVQLMDGTRDRDVLARELNRLLGGKADFETLVRELGRQAMLMA